ncbi:MAG: hypothetical protein ACRDKW_06350 [Actinomycetota bacterium]
MLRRIALFPCALVLVACTAASSDTGAMHPRDCVSGTGEVTDVAHEPPWRDPTQRTWTIRNGCRIRVDVLTDRTGSAHCGWDRTRVIATGNPVGDRYTNASDDLEYLRDPEGELGALGAAFLASTVVPEHAVDTGFRSATTQLWVDPDDRSRIWLRTGDVVEQWPLVDVPDCR